MSDRRRQSIHILLLATAIGAAYGAFAQTNPDDCPVILGVEERVVLSPPWGPTHLVDIHHNGVLRMKLTFQGATQEFAVVTNPVTRTVDKSCLTSAEPLTIEAWKYCEQSTKTTFSITPGPPMINVSATKPPDTSIRVKWKAQDVSSYRLRGILLPANQVLRDSTNWEGTQAEGTTYINTFGDQEGIVLVTLSGCGTTQEDVVDLSQYACDKPCNDKCEEMPQCAGDPVNTMNGNMRYEEVDPVPSNAFPRCGGPI